MLTKEQIGFCLEVLEKVAEALEQTDATEYESIPAFTFEEQEIDTLELTTAELNRMYKERK
jgi:hypothetical protein